MSPPSRGYTLPVWVAAAARASVAALQGEAPRSAWHLDLLQGEGRPPVPVPVGAAAPLGEGWALAQATCDPGDGLDLTRDLLVWALTRWEEAPPLAAEGEEAWLR